MSKVQEDTPDGIIFIEGDQGVPTEYLNNPFAGLSFRAASDVVQLLESGGGGDCPCSGGLYEADDVTIPKGGGDATSKGSKDSGKDGKAFEADFKKALDMLKLRYRASTGRGALWDIEPIGPGWHRLIKDRQTNLKVTGTRWLFSNSVALKYAIDELNPMVIRGTLTKDDAAKRLITALRKSLVGQRLGDATFTKPKSLRIQKQIMDAVKAKDKAKLKQLMVASNFGTKRFGRSFKITSVKLPWGTDLKNYINKACVWITGATLKGQTRLKAAATIKKDQRDGSLSFAFRSTSAKPGLPYHAARVDRLSESKMIGKAQHSASVLQRDKAMRFMPADKIRQSIKGASTNAGRSLNRVYNKTEAELRRVLREWQSDELDLDEARLQSSDVFKEAYSSIRDIARRASGLTEMGQAGDEFREEQKWFRSAVRSELKYWNNFLDEIDEGKVTGGAIDKRVEHYVRALRFMYEAARVQSMPDNVLLYWMGPPKDDPTICKGCAYMMENSPYTKGSIPAVPRDGATSCLTNCRHRIVVRVAESFGGIVERERRIPSRKKMLRELRELKGGRRLGASKARGRARNPFQGDRLTGRRIDLRGVLREGNHP